MILNARSHGVSGRYPGQDGTITNWQVLYAVDLQLAVHHRHFIGAHFSGRDTQLLSPAYLNAPPSSITYHDWGCCLRRALFGGEMFLQYLKEPGEPSRVCSPRGAGDEHSINDGFSEPHGDE